MLTGRQILKLRLQYFGHLMRREDSLEKTLMLGKYESKRRRGRQRTRWLDRVTEVTSMNLTQIREGVEDRRAWHALVHGVTKSMAALLTSTASRSLVNFMLVASMTLSNHLILCRPLLLLPSHFPSIKVFSRESSLLMRWPKYWSQSFRICPSSQHSGLIYLLYFT